VSRIALAVRSPIVRARVGRVEGRRSTRMGAAFRRVPTAAWVCALIALLNAVGWSLIVPPFEGKDESDHFAYVEQIVENGSLPENGQQNGNYSTQENLVLQGLHAGEVIHSPQSTSISSEAEQRTLIEADHAGASLRGSGEAGIATSEPPLYYTIQAIPYLLARGNILVQLQLMRLVGALFGAITALFTFLFIREVLPRSPWAATAGALAVALQPLLGFMSGSVNPDSMLYAVTAAVFYCLARAFRRGLTRRLAIVLGILIAVGFLTKLNFVGLAFGVYVGLIVLAVREARARGRAALGAPVTAAAIGVLPVGLFVLRNALASQHTLGIVSSGHSLFTPRELLHMLSYIWQFYLPRLPGMTHYFQGIATYRDIWFDRSVGLYGWMDTMFPAWVDNVALLPAAAVAVLFGRAVVIRRKALWGRLPEFGVYAALAVGLLVLIGASSYDSDALHHSPAFAEPRYLLPLLPLLGAVFALAVRGAGRRWAPAAGAALIVLVFGFDVVSQLQVIARYYG
jgi:4-amino-4-deoxy-L-arabinose transferase-like glycosyltransferase